MLGIVRGLTHLIIFDTRFFDMKTTLTILAALVFGLAAKADFISYTNSLSAGLDAEHRFAEIQSGLGHLGFHPSDHSVWHDHGVAGDQLQPFS